MHEIAVGELRLADIGSRVVAIDTTGNAYDGILTDAAATSWKYGERPEDKVRIRVTIRSGANSELKLEALPLDFRMQIDQGAALNHSTDQITTEHTDGSRDA